MEDIKNYFDKYIYIEDEINEIVTTYDKKIASIGFETNKLTLNGATKKIYAHAIKKDDVIYMPIIEMKDVYNLETTVVEKNVILDSLTRKQVKAYSKSNLSVKWKSDFFSKTVDKINKGDVVITIEGIAGIAITLIMSYIFINKLLAKLKGKELNKTIINSAIKETYKEFFIAIIPIIIASITFSFISWEPISSFGMVMFWGIVLIAAYNISISNLLLKLKASNK